MDKSTIKFHRRLVSLAKGCLKAVDMLVAALKGSVKAWEDWLNDLEADARQSEADQSQRAPGQRS